MKRNILIVCFNADKSTSAYAIRVYSNISALAASGYCVSVVRLVPIFHGAASWKMELEEAGALHIAEVPALPIARFALSRIASPFFAALVVTYFQMLWRIDITIAEGHEASSSTLFFPLRINIVDLHGAVPEELLYPEVAKPDTKNSLVDSLNRTEHRLLKKADHIFVVSERMIEHLASKWGGNCARNVSLLPISWRDTITATAPLHSVGLEYLRNKIVFCYSGGAQNYQCIEQMLIIFSKIHAANSETVFLIFSSNIDVISEMITRVYGENKVFIHLMSLKPSEVSSYLSVCRFGFVLRDDSLINKVACPTKINEYLSAGLILLCTSAAGHGPLAIQHTGAGLVIPLNPNEIDASALLDRLNVLSLEYDRNRVLTYLESFNNKENAKKMLRIIEDL